MSFWADTRVLGLNHPAPSRSVMNDFRISHHKKTSVWIQIKMRWVGISPMLLTCVRTSLCFVAFPLLRLKKWKAECSPLNSPFKMSHQRSRWTLILSAEQLYGRLVFLVCLVLSIRVPCTLPKFGQFHPSLWNYECVLSSPFHHGCYFEPWFLHLWVTRQLARSVAGREKSKWWSMFRRATCEGLFLKPGTHPCQNPNIINSSFFSPILNSKSAGRAPAITWGNPRDLWFRNHSCMLWPQESTGLYNVFLKRKTHSDGEERKLGNRVISTLRYSSRGSVLHGEGLETPNDCRLWWIPC